MLQFRWQKPLANTSRIQLQPNRPHSTHLSWWVLTRRGETLELSRDCALPESQRKQKRTDKRVTVLAAALGKSISQALQKTSSAPETGQSFSRSQRRPQAHYSQTSVLGAELLATGRMNALRQGRKRKLPQLRGLLTWKLNRAARAQRYQVPKSPC